MLEDCSEACHTCTVGSSGYNVKLSIVAQWNHRDYYFTMHCSSWPYKTSLFLVQCHCKRRTERSNITCTTSQANEQADNLVVGVTWMRIRTTYVGGFNQNWIHLQKWKLNVQRFYANSCEHYQCISNPVHALEPMWTWLNIIPTLDYFLWERLM